MARMRTTGGLVMAALLSSMSTATLAAPVELSVWGWLPGSVNGDIFARYIEEFHAKHPDIRIKVEKGSNEQNLLVAFAAGAAPDVVQGVGPWATALGEKGVLLPLDSFIDGPKGLRRSDYVDDLWSFSRVNGKTYQIAVDGNERALFVNADAVASAGIDIREPVRDWNDLLAWARKLTRRTGDKVERWGFDMHQENGGNRWHWVWLNEGEIFSPDGKRAMLDHPNTAAALNFAAQMVNTYGVAPRPGTVSGSSQANFINGVYGMIITSSTFLPALQKAGTEFITIPGPPGPGKKGYRFSGATASTLSIVRTTKHPEAAWTFIRWLAYEKGVSFANERGGIPYLKAGLRGDRFFKQPWEAFATSIMTYTPRNAYIPGLSESDWLPKFQAAWDSALRGEQGAEIVLRQAQDAINARLAEINQ